MKSFRNVLFWCHLCSGVIAGVIILIMSVTGVLLTYEKQMMESADRNAYAIAAPATGGSPIAVSAMLEKVRAAEGELPTSVTLRADANAPVEVSYGRTRKQLVHPYTGEVLGGGAEGMRGFFRTVTDWHRWLGSEGEGRDTGKAITGACNFAFLFLVVSGIYLWWPRNKTAAVWRGILWFRRRRTAKARDFNWHNVIGFWCLLPLFAIVASAVVISYPWASDLVYRAYGEEPPAGRGPEGAGGAARGGEQARRGDRGASEGRPSEGRGGRERGERGGRGERDSAPRVSLAGIDTAVAAAREQVPGWRTISFRLPEGTRPLEFTIDSGTGGQPQLRGKLTLDPGGAEPAKWEPFADQSPARKMRSLLRFTHTGEVGGIVGQTLAGIASLGGAVLVWTGLALSWRRLRSWLDRRSRPGRSLPEPAEDRHQLV